MNQDTSNKEDELYELCLRQVKHLFNCKQEPCSGCPELARQLQEDFEEYNKPHVNQEVRSVLGRLKATRGNPIALSGSDKYKGGVIPLSAIESELKNYEDC